MRARRGPWFVGLFLCLSVVASAKSKPQPEPFQWPAPPDEAARKAASLLKNDGGLVILERQTKIRIASWRSDRPGLRIEEFDRFLVVGQEGIQNASMPLKLGWGWTLETVEGRTTAPDGAVTALDGEKDVERFDVTRLGDQESLYTQASVHFPAPQVGSVLDLHWISFKEGVPYHLVLPLLLEQTTTVRGETELTFDDETWSLLTVGDSRGTAKLERADKGKYLVHLSTCEIDAREVAAPPVAHTSPTLVCYINYSGVPSKSKDKDEAPKVATSTLSLDSRGRVQGFSFPPGAEVTDWWIEYLKKKRGESQEFMKRASRVESLPVEWSALAGLPLEERLARLYRLAQTTVRRNPYAVGVTDINSLLAQGANGDEQVTLLFAHFLERSKIPYSLGLLADRKMLRFSPVIHSGQVYGFIPAVVVPRPGKNPLVMVPGDFSLDFGVLPYDRQDALVFWLEGEDTVKTFYSAVDEPAADAASFRYALEMDASGKASGSVTLSERGAKSRGFRRWYVMREIKRKSPKRDKYYDRSDTELKDELDEELEKWFWAPGSLFTFSGYELVKCDQSAAEPLEIKAVGQAQSIGQASGDRWLVLANPLMAGYSSPFVRPARRFAIWNETGGLRTVEGELLLPAGAKVLEVPKPQEVKGPEGLIARYTTEALEREGRVVLHSKLEYTVPLVLGSQSYGAYRLYLDGIARMGQDKCIVQFVGEKELE